MRQGRPQPLSIFAGDVFAVPLRGILYGFGRLLYMKDKWRLAEFFAHFDEAPVYKADIVESGRIMPVHNIVTLPIESGDWPIVKRDPLFICHDIERLTFYRGLKGSRSSVSPLSNISSPLPESEVPKMASSMPQFPEYISDLLWEKFEQQSTQRNSNNT